MTIHSLFRHVGIDVPETIYVGGRPIRENNKMEKSFPHLGIGPEVLIQNALIEYCEPDGSKLENGMIVVLSDSEDRFDPINPMAQVTNRWCGVTELQFYGGSGKAWLEFTGVYEDGQRISRRYKTSVRWMVNRASAHKPSEKPPVANLTENDVRRIVREELSNFMDAARKKAGVEEYLDFEKMEDALVGIVEHVSKEAATEAVNDHENRFVHAWS
jgi:hypothetical protein